MRLSLISLCLFLADSLIGCRSSQVQTEAVRLSAAPESGVKYDSAIGRFNPSVVMVSYALDGGKSALLSAAERVGGKIVYDYVNFNLLAIEKPDSMTMSRAVEYFLSVKGVLNAVPDQMCELDGGEVEAL